MNARLFVMVAGLLAAVVVTAGCSGHGRTAPASEVPAPRQMAELAEIFAGAGLDATVFDDRSVVLTRDGLNILVFREDGGASLQAVLACTRQGRGEVADILAWNAGRRFGRAYLDRDGRPVLASDLALEPPVTPDVVAAWGSLVLDMASRFVVEAWPAPFGAGQRDPVINE